MTEHVRSHPRRLTGRAALLIAVVTLCAAAIGLTAVVLHLRTSASPAAVAERFLDAVASDGSWQELMTTSAAKEQGGRVPLIGSPALRDALNLRVEADITEADYRAGDERRTVAEQDADTALVPVQLTYRFDAAGRAHRVEAGIRLALSREMGEERSAWLVSGVQSPSGKEAATQPAPSAEPCASPANVLIDLSDTARIDGTISQECLGGRVQDVLAAGTDPDGLAAALPVLSPAAPPAELLGLPEPDAPLTAHQLNTADAAVAAVMSHETDAEGAQRSSLLALVETPRGPDPDPDAEDADTIWFALNEALDEGDRDAFLSSAEGHGREALARWWDNTSELGWNRAAVSPTWVSEDGDRATVILGAQLPFAPAPARGGGDPDAGLTQVQGTYYSVELAGSGAQRRIVGFTAASAPEPWDEGQLHVVRREHVVLYAQQDEATLADESIDAAEAAAVEALGALEQMGGEAPVDGFLVGITNDAERMRRWQFGDDRPWDMAVAAFARPMVRPSAAEPWLAADIAVDSRRSSGTSIVLGPRSADDRSRTLVHEYAHAMLAAAYPSLHASPPAAVTEGLARLMEWQSGHGVRAYVRPAARRLIAESGAEAFSTEQLRGESSWIGYAAAGSYYAFVADTGGSAWDLAIDAKADADGLVGFARRHPEFSIEAWQRWVADQ